MSSIFLRRSCLILGVLFCSIFCCGAEFKIEKIFDKKDQGGDYKHPASIAELSNGDLYLSFYGGGGEYIANTADWGSRLVKGQKKWSQPKVIADTPFISDGNPVIWQAPDGLVWLFYVVRYGDTWSDSVIMAKVSSDKALSWSDPIIMTAEKGTMVRSQPIVLNNGDYLLPIYHECGGDREEVTPETTSLFLRIDPKTKTWKETNRIKGPTGVLQPSVVQLDDDHLIAYMRRGGGYEEDIRDYVYKAESQDGGYTWSDAVATEFPNPNAAIDLLKLKSGNLLLVYNDSFTDRNPLTVALSTDQGKTWDHKKNIIDKNEDYAYPYVIQTKDGKIHLIFTSHERSQVNRCVFTEEDLLK
ncbi:MAG: sialidase family protein [Thermoguttaceae bacterium]